MYSDYISTFEHLLEKDDSCTVHHSNLHFLSIELYKVVNDLTTNISSDIFLRNNQEVSLRSQNYFALPRVRTESCGKGALRYLGPLIWNIIPSEIKNVSSLNKFKKQIRQWRPLECPCRLCKNYIPDVGFLFNIVFYTFLEFYIFGVNSPVLLWLILLLFIYLFIS